MVDCNLQGKTQICVYRPTNSRKDWTFESLHELVLSKFKNFPNMVCNSSKRCHHFLFSFRHGNWTTSSTTKPTNHCQLAWRRTTTTWPIIWIHGTTSSSLRRLWIQSATLQCSGVDFMSNLIGIDLQTPEFAYAYMQSMPMPSFAYFDQSIAVFLPLLISSTKSILLFLMNNLNHKNMD